MTTDLIKRLTEAGEGSRELDHRIACRLTCGVSGPFGAFPNAESWIKAAIAGRWNSPHYTTNLQDAVSAVPDDFDWLARNQRDQRHGGFANINRGGERPNEGAPCWPVYAATPALALCIAILKALEAKDADK